MSQSWCHPQLHLLVSTATRAYSEEVATISRKPEMLTVLALQTDPLMRLCKGEKETF